MADDESASSADINEAVLAAKPKTPSKGPPRYKHIETLTEDTVEDLVEFVLARPCRAVSDEL